jgi:polygalacturonase
VLIEDCYFETGDDCIAINSGMNEDGWRVNRPCENILIRNCHMHEGHGGVVIGSGMSGGVRNVYAHHCKFSGGDRGIRLKSMRGRGGYVENIWFENIEITDMRHELIQINMYYESTTIPPNTDASPDFRNINIKDIQGAGAAIAIAVYGLPEHRLEQITMENLTLSAEKGLICHDIEGVTIKNLKLQCRKEPEIEFTNVSKINILQSETA